METLVKELAEQAGEYADFESGICTDEFLKKFAKLIVQECIFTIESQRSSGENTDEWTITRDMCYRNMMDRLKQHFGVE